MTIEQELITLLESRSAALVRGDKATLDTLFAPDFIYTNAYGERVTKAGYLEKFVGRVNMVWQAQEISEAQVWLYGETAIVSCRVHDVATYNGEPFDAHFRTTHTLVKLEGRWQIVASHTSPLDNP